MTHLNNSHIEFIIKDLTYRGIVLEGFQEEVIDHICSAVEEEMSNGKRFLDAYHSVLKTFGNTSGLRNTQQQTLKSKNQKATIMLRNYVTIGWRNLRKHTFYSLINVVGLAIGVAACLVIVLFIQDELSFDTYNINAHRIYRVEAEVKTGGNQFKMAYRSAPEANALMQDYPEIESTVRFRNYSPYLVKAANGVENFKEKNVMWADSTFFKIFSVKVLEGDPKTALAEPSSVAISKKMAEKYFPGTSALGQSLILDNNYNSKVTAVYEDIPAASHFHFDILISMVGDWPPVCREAKSSSFMNENFNTYLLLKEGANAKALENKFPAFLEKHMGPQMGQAFGDGFTLEKFKSSGNKYEMSLRPLTDIHLHSDVKGEFEPNGSITYVYLFAVIAAFILTIACINFMNLSTARSSNRAKEVGVRKVMGSMRSHLVRQFLTESMLITLLAFVLSIALAYLFLPLFNNLSSKNLQLPLDNVLFYLVLIGASILIGFMAGIYPSFFLSAFKPVNVLKGHIALGMKSGFIRSSLVVFQFVISLFLIIGAITVNRQLNFIQNKKLGFEKDQVIIIHDPYALRPKVQSFKDEVLRLSSIETGTMSGYIPIQNDWAWRNNTAFWREGVSPTPENLMSFQMWGVDEDYIKTFRMKVIQGRDFSKEFPSDNTAVVLNATAVQRLGLGDDPVGKKISRFIGDRNTPEKNRIETWTVVGVVEDFHFSSMKESISPVAIVLSKNDGSVSFLFKPDKTNEVIQSIEKIWKDMAPGEPFQYSFLDEDFENMYHAEQRLGKIFILFAGLAIVIACLGLFALTAFTAEQRTKEIGIRKVLGASVSSIVLLLSRDFGKLILIAFLIATPIAWYAVNLWLQDYTYKTQIGLPIYLLAGGLAFTIALITMGYQSIRAANTDPVTSLKNE